MEGRLTSAPLLVWPEGKTVSRSPSPAALTILPRSDSARMKSRRLAAPDGPPPLTLFLSIVFKLFPHFIKPFHFRSCFPRPRFPHEVLNAQDAAGWVWDAAAFLHGTELKVLELVRLGTPVSILTAGFGPRRFSQE